MEDEQKCTIDPLPCPFCGSKTKKIERVNDSDLNLLTYYDIGCTNDDCYLCCGAGWWYATYNDAVDGWNKRS